MKKRYCFAFVPAVLFSGTFLYLTIATGWFSLPLFLVSVAFVVSGILAVAGRFLWSIIGGILPGAYFFLSALISHDPYSGARTTFLSIAGGILLYYACYYLFLWAYEREIKK